MSPAWTPCCKRTWQVANSALPDLPAVRVALAVSLFRNGSVSAGFAARVADKPLAQMLTLLSSQGIPLTGESKADEVRVLICTDVLSEGQNLQDSNVVVNFDLPWAIIRLIQRAGRVDRIGQRAEEIHCYSFQPHKPSAQRGKDARQVAPVEPTRWRPVPIK